MHVLYVVVHVTACVLLGILYLFHRLFVWSLRQATLKTSESLVDLICHFLLFLIEDLPRFRSISVSRLIALLSVRYLTSINRPA
jgi:hypothetical protein